jgi:hypothetical protein
MSPLTLGDVVQLKEEYRHCSKFLYGRALITEVLEGGQAMSKGSIIHPDNVHVLFRDHAIILSKSAQEEQTMTIPKAEYELMLRIVNRHLGGI